MSQSHFCMTVFLVAVNYLPQPLTPIFVCGSGSSMTQECFLGLVV